MRAKDRFPKGSKVRIRHDCQIKPKCDHVTGEVVWFSRDGRCVWVIWNTATKTRHCYHADFLEIVDAKEVITA